MDHNPAWDVNPAKGKADALTVLRTTSAYVYEPTSRRKPKVEHRAWAGETGGFYYVVVDALLKTGFTPEDAGKIGGANYLRVFGQAMRS